MADFKTFLISAVFMLFLNEVVLHLKETKSYHAPGRGASGSYGSSDTGLPPGKDHGGEGSMAISKSYDQVSPFFLASGTDTQGSDVPAI